MSSAAKRSLRRRLLTALAVVAAGLVLLVAGLLVALRLEPVRQALLGRAAATVERESGWAIAARDFRLRPLRGSLELWEVSLGAPGEEPLLTVEELRVEASPWRLLRGRAEIALLELRAPALDLTRPLPTAPAKPEEPDAPAGPLRLPEIGSLLVRQGWVRGEIPGTGEEVSGIWRAAAVELTGRAAEGSFELALGRSSLELMPEGGATRELEVRAAVKGRAEGPLELEMLSLTGAGVRLDASGSIGLSDEQPMQVRFELEGDAAQLLGRSVPAADLRAEGRLDMRAQEGQIRLRAPALPAELLEPEIGGDLFRRLAAGGTRLALDVELRLGPSTLERVAGEARLVWSRGDENLLELALEPQNLGAAGVLAPFEARLLPGAPGLRELHGTLRLEDLRQLGAAAVDDGGLLLRLTDLGVGLEELRRQWPDLLADLPLASGLAGPLLADLRFRGGVEDLEAEGEMEWRPAPGSSLLLSARGRPLEARGEAVLQVEELALGALMPEARGVVGGRLELRGGPARYRGALRLGARGLGFGEEETLLEELRLEASGGLWEVRISELVLEGRGHRLEGPLDLGLERGVLRIEAPALTVDGVEGQIGARLPLATLARLPGVEQGIAILPGRRAVGPLELRWRVAPADWSPLLERLTGAPGTLRAGATGALAIDPDRPLAGEGTVELSPLQGVVEGLELEAQNPLRLTLEGARLALEPLQVRAGEARFQISGAADLDPGWAPERPPAEALEAMALELDGEVPLTLLTPLLGEGGEAQGRAKIDLELAGDLDDPRARLRLAGPDAWVRLPAPRGSRLGEPDLELELAGRRLDLRRLGLTLDGQPLVVEGSAELAEGRLRIELTRVSLAGLGGALGAELPAGLVGVPGASSGPVSARWELPEAEWRPLLDLFALVPEVTSLRLGGRGALELDPASPADAVAELEITRFDLAAEGHRLRADDAVRLRLAEARLELEPLRLWADEQPLELGAQALLDPAWRQPQPLSALVAEVELEGHGTLPAALLNPFLAGGSAEGELQLEVRLGGAPDRLTGSLRARGPGASLFYRFPYVTRVAAPDLELSLEEGGVARLAGTARLNEGELDLSGGFTPEGFASLEAVASGVRYRFDYGLLAVLDGKLELTRSAEGGSVLSGSLKLDKGVLTRSIDLDLDFLRGLLLPVDLAGTEASPLDDVVLDLDFTTREGVRIKNNVADLLVRWEPVAIRGTLAAPVLEGAFEIEPGGLVFAYGQTVRLDRASILYPGEPDQPPTVDLAVTSSLEDPTIGRLSGQDPFAAGEAREAEGGVDLDALTAGVGLTLPLAARLGEALGGAQVSLQPVLIFGETDPGARLTVSRDFSANVAVAASIDLRQVEAQTYVIDLHEFEALPQLRTQVYTNDEGDEGTILQQRFRLGGSRPEEVAGPRIRRIRFERPARVPKRGLRKAIGYGKGDRLPAGSEFFIEVEVGEYLRRRGYSAARVEVTAEPPAGGRKGVVLRLQIDPGPHATFSFEGEKLPGALRRAVTSLYRSDFYEEASLEEMEEQAVRAYRSLGYLRPEVEAVAEPRDPAEPAGDRVVRVRAEAGERVELGAPRFEGVGAEEAELLASRFITPLQRAELAAGLPAAQRRLLSTMVSLGYPETRIESLQLDDGSQTLRGEVEPGPRRLISAVEIGGLAAAEAERLRGLVPLESGQPARADALARGAVALRRDLRNRGYLEAAVRVQALPESAERPLDTVVRYEVETGPFYRLDELRFSGLRATRPGWLGEITGLPVGDPLGSDRILAARRSLWETGLFSSVLSSVTPLEEGEAAVAFDLSERSRYQISYGLRWDSEEDASFLIEAIDRNALGRGLTLGLQARYASDDESLRGFAQVPRIFGGKTALELFALAREEVRSGLITETLETTLQLAYPLGSRATARVYGRYNDFHVSEEEPDPDFPIDIRLSRPYLGVQFLYDSRPAEVLPVRGILASVDLSGSDDLVGSDFTYVRLLGQVNLFRPLARFAGRRLSWAQSVRVGLADAFGDEVIFEERFFAGGEYSVRGYPTKLLGRLGKEIEILGSGDFAVVRTQGGEALLVLNEELRAELWPERLTALLFFDAGGIWLEPQDFGQDLFKSVGLGVRVVSPVGLLRLDLAHPLDRRPIDPEFKVYFGLGTTF